MRTLERIGLAILLAGLFFPAASDAQDPTVQRLLTPKRFASRAGSEENVDPGPVERAVERLERAFENGDAGELERCLSEKRIYLSLKARGEEPGYYGPSQVKFIFDRLFSARKNASFDYRKEDIEISSRERAELRAEWSYSATGGDGMVREDLRFHLDRDRDGGDWRVSEIRSQSR
jgi:hypothetical protein